MATPSNPTPNKVLVIDDERGPRESVRILLKNEFQVACADNVDAGIALLRANPPDVVIMDIRMPGKTGIDGLREIRALDALVSVIMFTGYGTLETAQDAIRMGATDYLKKPIDTKELLDVVRRCVRRTSVERLRHQAETDLTTLVAKIRAEMQRKEQMASLGQKSAEFAHDLRNPLTAVLGFLSLLTDQLQGVRARLGDRWDETEEYLGLIGESVHRCKELSEQWLSLGSCDPTRRTSVCLAEVVNEVLRATSTLAEKRGVQVSKSPDDSPARMLQADATQLQRAIQNVIVNAIEAAPEQTGTIRIACRTLGDTVRLQVVDNGPGIPADRINQLFTPFYTSKETGTGLGLCIAKQAIEAHGGQIAIESANGRGTTVTITLPVTG